MNLKIIKKIEAARNELIRLAKSEGLSSEATIESSKALDRLLNEYMKLEGEFKRSRKGQN
ncbi:MULTISPECIES: aspartyl-phosphate phosphatase Spo0E family protein [Sporosarcina]|uniref:Aspartyl-phosphate phosphatase Spo0E family protein n=1 Tax=Sporosarcina contaminans TaxID=633403 RepID=A0ABW3U2D1_9BACL